MSSYAQEVKDELAHIFDADVNCQRAEFIALMRVGAKKVDSRLEFQSSNAAVARKVITLAKKFLPLVKPEVAAVRMKRLRKELNYIVRFIAAGEVQTFVDAPDIDELLKRTRYKISYLRGAFLAKGTVNRPESLYMLGMIATEAEARFIRKQLDKLDFGGGFYKRKKKFVVWLREADTICDFLAMVGADNAVERFEVARNLKEIRQQVNRVVNMETSALNKSINVAQRQLADIQLLRDKGVSVSDKLQEAMEARLDNPTGTVAELATKLPIKRAALQYRFKIIHRLAQEVSKK